jgi:hypothetical protein
MKRSTSLCLVLIVSMLIACKPKNPPPTQAAVAQTTGTTLKVTRLLWTDSNELPQNIREQNQERGRFGLMAHVQVENSKVFGEFLKQADARVLMEAKNYPTLKISFDPGCWWFENGAAWIYVPFGPSDRQDLKPNVSYRVIPQNHAENFLWNLDQNITR